MAGKSQTQAYLLLRAIRPRQWVKNLAVFAALIFGGFLFQVPPLILSLTSFIVLCLVSSAAYLINDLIDLNSDRRHPFKKNRPLASGKLKKQAAYLAITIFWLGGLMLGHFASAKLFWMALLFSFLQFSYTLVFKNIPVVDILVIAGAYILRVYTGEVVLDYHLSVWLMIAIVSLSLFLSAGKRKSELSLLTDKKGRLTARTRTSLIRYKGPLLDVYLSFFATSTWIAYGFYTFSHQPVVTKVWPEKTLFWQNLLGERKWLMTSIPFVLYGLMRYLQLIYEHNQGEAPERLLFVDKSLLATVIVWGITVILAIYLV